MANPQEWLQTQLPSYIPFRWLCLGQLPPRPGTLWQDDLNSPNTCSRFEPYFPEQNMDPGSDDAG